MYFVVVESAHGEEFIAAGETLDEATHNLRNMTTEYFPENIEFFKGERINVSVQINYIEH